MFCWVSACSGTSPPADCFAGPKLCQHGTEECNADTLEACVMDVYPEPSAYTKFITCFEGEHESSLAAAPKCAAASGLDYAPIAACAGNLSRAEALDVANAKATVALGVSKVGTPWVMLNGVNVVSTGLLQQVCAAFGSDLPVGCK